MLPSLHVPPVHFNDGLGGAQPARTVRRGYLTRFTRHQRDVVVLPKHGQNLFPALTPVHFQTNEKRHALTRILQRNVSHSFVALAFVTAYFAVGVMYQVERSQSMVSGVVESQ